MERVTEIRVAVQDFQNAGTLPLSCRFIAEYPTQRLRFLGLRTSGFPMGSIALSATEPRSSL